MNSNAFPLSRTPTWKYKAPATPARYQVIDSNGGTHRASSYEYNFAMALQNFNLEFLFQVEYWGGKSRLGGLLLDFMVFTKPLNTPVFVNGDYWHGGQRKELDLVQQALLSKIPSLREPVVLWGQDTATYEDAVAAVRKWLL